MSARFGASAMPSPASTNPPLTCRTSMSGRIIQQQQQNQPRFYYHPEIHGDSPIPTADRSPASPAVSGHSACSAASLAFDRAGAQANHDMAQSQQSRMADHELAVMAGTRSMGAPTPTSTSSYGAKEEGGYMTASGRMESDFGETDDDGYGGGFMHTGIGEDTMGPRLVSPEYCMETGDHDGNIEVIREIGEADGNDVSETGYSEAKEKSEGDGQEPGQIWSETKTKAGKERKRLPLACIMCRRKKIRCSGEKPACKHCLRSRIPCVYRQTARKTVPRTDYMTMLDRRLKRMEERLLKNVPKDEISAMLANTGRSVVKPVITAAGRKRTAEMAFNDDTTDSWGNSAPVQSKSRRIEECTPTLAQPATTDSNDGSHCLPPKDIQEHLAEVFFEYVYGQPYFVLHKPSFMRRLRNGTAPPVLILAVCAVSARFSKHPGVLNDSSFSAGEVFAVEARHQILKNFDTPNITNLTVCLILGLHEVGAGHGARGWAFGGMATRMAYALQLHKEVDRDSTAKIQQSMRPDYLHEGGMVGGYMSFTDKEIRRRSMWACFVTDRFLSVGAQRPFMLNESEIEIQLPVHDRNLKLDAPAITEQLDGGVKDTSDIPEDQKLASATANMGIAAYMIRVIAMYSRVIRFQEQGGKEKDGREIWDPESPFAEFNSEIEHFIDDLPEQFQYNAENVESQVAERTLNQFVFLHVSIHNIRLSLHRSALSISNNSGSQSGSEMPLEFGDSAREIALDAASKIAQIVAESQDRGVPVVSSFVGFCTFGASLVHLVMMFHPQKETRTRAKKHTEMCLKFLLQLKQYWRVFRFVADNLKTLYQRLQESFPKGLSMAARHREASRALWFGDLYLKVPQLAAANGSDGHEKAPEPKDRANSSNEDAALSHRPDLQTADEFFAQFGSKTSGSPNHTPQQGFPHSAPEMSQPEAALAQQHLPESHTKSHNQNQHHQHHQQQSASVNSIQHSTAARAQTQAPPSAISMISVPTIKIETNMSNGLVCHRQANYAHNYAPHADNSLSVNSPAPVMATSPPYPLFAITPQPQMQSHQQTHHHSQNPHSPCLYDAYPGGSESAISVTPNHCFWHGIDPYINFIQDQTNCMPFNDLPIGFTPELGHLFEIADAGPATPPNMGSRNNQPPPTSASQMQTQQPSPPPPPLGCVQTGQLVYHSRGRP